MHEKRAAMRIIFKGSSITFAAQSDKQTARGTYKVDSSKNPKTMDIKINNGNTEVITLVIYERHGDTLKLCHFLGKIAGEERPKEFGADKRTVLGVLKRE